MKFFKTPDDLDGYGIIVEADDIKKPLDLPELKCAWTNILWEGVIKQGTRETPYYKAYYLTSNSHIIEFVFADREWLDDGLKEILEKHRTDKRGV